MAAGKVTLDHFDVSKVIAHGASLMAAEGTEFDAIEESGECSSIWFVQFQSGLC